MGATVDCEAIGTGLLAQPINAVTSLALVIGGLLLIARSRNALMGWALIAAGFGSFLFHGPLAPGGRWIHDVTLAWLIVVALITALERSTIEAITSLVVFAGLFAAAPWVAVPLTAVASFGVIASLLWIDRSRFTIAPVAILVAAAAIGQLGGTGGPLCNPDSWIQLHALWHIGAAVAVTSWAMTATFPRGDR